MIRCLPTGKIYVGSTVDLQSRWTRHKLELRHGKHHNPHLQSAWNKYGENNFEFSVLEAAEIGELLRLEQSWIARTICTDPNNGFNIFPTAGSPGDTYAQIWEGFVDPDGKEVTIRNLFAFCRENQLDWRSMHRLAIGKSKLKSYKGWTHRNSVRQRSYAKSHDGFIDPDGKRVAPIKNLAAFCREHGLDNTHMVAVANGRLLSHRGWRFQNSRARLSPKTYTGFVNPAGLRVTIFNLAAFCRERGLDEVHMRELMSGVRKSHKGWTWNDDE